MKTIRSGGIYSRILCDIHARGRFARICASFGLLITAWFCAEWLAAQQSAPQEPSSAPPRVVQAQRFLARRGYNARNIKMRPRPLATSIASATAGSAGPVWQPLGPAQVLSPNYGQVTGRVTSLALDPADPTANRLFLGTTGGGVWVSQNAGTANAASVAFTPLTDSPAVLIGAAEPSLSIGALSVQPGGTGVILAGTGDPNDALDSYYGAGILRSADGGKTWTLIQSTSDQAFSFVGEGFAGFAWSTTNPQLAVAAVSHAFESPLVSGLRPGLSYAGLYYSTDGGINWHLATIADASGNVQGPLDQFAQSDGNAVTAAVWNPVRHLFLAAVRYHGYYQSADGITWTRLNAQPGTSLTTGMCPRNAGSIGSVACPILRGALAVNPATGDTFAWTVDTNDQDQGLWQDLCSETSGACSNQMVAFQKQWNTSALETNTMFGSVTIANGDYNLVVAAIPSGQDTVLLAGANDVWRCALASGCAWRNTTNSDTCMSAQVASYQHAFEWDNANPQEVFIGNDSGLWRSTDGIAETGAVCASTDAAHFQNLNAGLGSLAEVESLAQGPTSPYTMMVGLGVNGTAGVASSAGPTAQWPQIVGGEGGPVAMDPAGTNWYVNNGAGVSIHRCTEGGNCAPSDFGAAPVVNDADVAGDGYAMTEPAPFLVDPLDSTQVLIGTCRVWRGPADGSAWSAANAISPILDGVTGNAACDGDALIRSVSAQTMADGGEVIYVGMYGAANGGATRAGHVMKAVFHPASGGLPAWQDITLNPVTNFPAQMNSMGLDVSSIFVDPHDATGNTVYVTIEGFPSPLSTVRQAYQTTDGGAHWAVIASNLPQSPANSIVVDPQDANTVYIALDSGVYSTSQIASCSQTEMKCWAPYGSGLPNAPVVQLSAAPPSSSPNVLAAGTYGRGVWIIPLKTAGIQNTTASVDPDSLKFAAQPYASASPPQTVTLTNTGAIALALTAISTRGDFAETDNCANATINLDATCTIAVTFSPSSLGAITGQLTISANVPGGQIIVPLTGIGTTAGTVSPAPTALDFGTVQVGVSSGALPVTLKNKGAVSVEIASVAASAPFTVAANGCGSTLAANTDCQITVQLTPTQTGPLDGTLTFTDSAGVQIVTLTGTGGAAPTDTLSATSIAFPATVAGQLSASQSVTLTNSGDVALTGIAVIADPGFQASNLCGTSLAAHSNCSISAVFAPVSSGNVTGNLTVADDFRTQIVTLSGIALAPPVMGVNPAQLVFPAQLTGTTSAPLTLTVTNSGGAPMSTIGFVIAGPSASAFATGTTTCSGSLKSSSSCTVQITFTPSTVGGNMATLTVTSATQGVQPVQVPLSGTGQAAAGLNVSPGQMMFQQPVLGQASAPQAATITNTSAVAAGGLNLTIASPFSLAQNTCGSSLAAGTSCTVGVVFTPSANGVVSGSLTVNSTIFTNTVVLQLSGAGGAAGTVQVQPALLTFSAIGVGNVSSPQTVTVTNPSAVVPLTDLTVTVSGGFNLAANTCPATLAASAICTVSVAFAPTSAGSQTGNLSVASTMLAAAVVAPLSGMGMDFTAGSSGNTSQTVASGQTASYTLTLTPMSGSAGTFTFQCGALPANAVCRFSPTSVSVAANATGSVTVQIATGQGTSAAASPGPRFWRVLPMACGLLLLPLAWRRRRTLALLVLAAIAISAAGCSGAGGGGGGNPPGGGSTATPAGTYSVPVSVSCSGVTHKVTLTLVVD